MGDQLFLERFIWFDSKVRGNRYPNAFKLAEEFEVSPKTAQRSIEYFRDRLLAPLQYDYTKRGYFYEDPNFQLPLTRISEEELLALLISRKLISEASGGMLGKELEDVSTKLCFLLATSFPGRANPEEAFSFRWRTISPADPQIFKTVTSALIQCRLLDVTYRSADETKHRQRIVEPHHMVNYLGNWHLIAFCHLRQDWRTFLLSRMDEAQLQAAPFALRPNSQWQPNLLDTFGIYQNKGHFPVTLRFSPERSRRVLEERWHEHQVDTFDETGALTRTIEVSHHAEITLEILRHGAHVEVLEPEWLRTSVAEELAAAALIYR